MMCRDSNLAVWHKADKSAESLHGTQVAYILHNRVNEPKKIKTGLISKHEPFKLLALSEKYTSGAWINSIPLFQPAVSNRHSNFIKTEIRMKAEMISRKTSLTGSFLSLSPSRVSIKNPLAADILYLV